LISLLVYLLLSGKISFKKKSKEYNLATKKEIYNFLKINARNAYTGEILLNNINENIDRSSFKRYIKKTYDRILSEMVSDQQIDLSQKNGQNFYLFPSE